MINEKINQLPIPRGYEQIVQSFGDLRDYIAVDGHILMQWEIDTLGLVHLPFPMPLAWDKKISVSMIRCHKKLMPIFTSVFKEIYDEGLKDYIESFGGCYQFRSQRAGKKFSTHCWGIAIDLNPDTNKQGTIGRIDPSLVEIFTKHGFFWGGHWQGKRKDPMHFQYAFDY